MQILDFTKNSRTKADCAQQKDLDHQQHWLTRLIFSRLDAGPPDSEKDKELGYSVETYAILHPFVCFISCHITLNPSPYSLTPNLS